MNSVFHPAFDAAIVGNSLYLAYERANGSRSEVALYKYSLANPPVEQANTIVSGEIGANVSQNSYYAITVDGGAADHIWVGYAGNTSLTGTFAAMIATFHPTTLAQQLTRTRVDDGSFRTYHELSLCRFDANSCVYALTANGIGLASYVEYATRSYRVTDAGVATGMRETEGTWLLTRPFVLGNTAYTFLADLAAFNEIAVGSPNAFVDAASYLVECPAANTSSTYPHRFVGLVDIDIAGIWEKAQVSTPVAIDANTVVALLPTLTVTPKRGQGWQQGARLVQIAIGPGLPDDAWRSVEMQREAVVAASRLTAYDAKRTFEYGFPRGPIIDGNTTVAANGSGSMKTGTYLYSAFSSFVSAQSVTHRSPAAVTFTVTVPAGNAGNVALAYLPQTLAWKGSEASDTAGGPLGEALRESTVIFRTVVEGSALHKRAPYPSRVESTNNPTANPQTFVDSDADASIAGMGHLRTLDPIYTLGELDEYCPPASLTIARHKNRLWVVSGDRRTIWFSKDFTENVGTAPGFHPTQILSFDEDVIGMQTLDDKLIVFSEHAIWCVVGDGPAVNGDGGWTVFRIQSDVGLHNPRSLVHMPDGLLFESVTGIYLLTRKLELVFVGQAVQDQLLAFPTITSAVLYPVRNQVRFTANDAAGTSGIVLVFDYLRKAWTTFQYFDAVQSNTATPIADACIWNDVWTFVTPTGKVYREDSSTHLDNGTHWVTATMETAWISSDGPLGYQRVRKARLIGTRHTSSDLRLKIAVDHASTYAQDKTFASDAIDALPAGTDIGLVLKVQKSRAFRMYISDATPSANGASVGSGQGLDYSAFGFEIEPKPGMDRRAAGATG